MPRLPRWMSGGMLLSLPTTPWLALVAEASDPASLSGGAGWVGAGLLGTVLGWLLWVHLPAKDRQIAVMIESRDKLAVDMARIASETERERRADFKEALLTMARSTDRVAIEIAEVRELLQRSTGVLGHEARTAAHRSLLSRGEKGASE